MRIAVDRVKLKIIKYNIEQFNTTMQYSSNVCSWLVSVVLFIYTTFKLYKIQKAKMTFLRKYKKNFDFISYLFNENHNMYIVFPERVLGSCMYEFSTLH